MIMISVDYGSFDNEALLGERLDEVDFLLRFTGIKQIELGQRQPSNLQRDDVVLEVVSLKWHQVDVGLEFSSNVEVVALLNVKLCFND